MGNGWRNWPRGGRGAATFVARTCLRPQTAEPGPVLLFAPVKRLRLDLIVEKATELGASMLMPVVTERTIVTGFNPARLQSIAIEAAEQCGRLTIPEIKDPIPLAQALAEWNPEHHMILLDESGGGQPIAEILTKHPLGPLALLIGPEGGFTKTELDGLRGLSFAVAASLGPRILRAETAVLAALACVQAISGNWRPRQA